MSNNTVSSSDQIIAKIENEINQDFDIKIIKRKMLVRQIIFLAFLCSATVGGYYYISRASLKPAPVASEVKAPIVNNIEPPKVPIENLITHSEDGSSKNSQLKIYSPSEIFRIEQQNKNGVNIPKIAKNNPNNSLPPIGQTTPGQAEESQLKNSPQKSISNEIIATSDSKPKIVPKKEPEKLVNNNEKIKTSNIVSPLIAPKLKTDNIFAIKPPPESESKGWEVTQIYKKFAIIKNSQGKAFAVHPGSYVEGKEVLNIENGKVYLTGNIVVSK